MLEGLQTAGSSAEQVASSDCPANVDLSLVLVCGPAEETAARVRQCQQWMAEYVADCELVVVTQSLGAELRRELDGLLDAAPFPIRFVKYHLACGPSKGLRLGLEKAQGNYIVVLPPSARPAREDVHRVIEALREGLDYVASVRPRPARRWRSVRMTIYNWLCGAISGVHLNDINCGLCGVRREVLESLPLYGDLHLFLPMLAVRQGFTVGEIDVCTALSHWPHASDDSPRYLRSTLNLLTLFFLTRFTEKPFRLFGSIGGGLGAAGILLGAILVAQRVMGEPLSDRPMLILAVLLLVIGIQVMSLGLLGELIIYVHSGADRFGHVKDVCNGSSEIHERTSPVSERW